MICMKCRRRLKADANACLCGWTAATDSGPNASVPCAYSGCGTPALVFVPFANVNLCSYHYPQWWTPERLDAKKRWAMERAGYSPVVQSVLDRNVEREPGADDEELRDAA